MRTRRGRLSRPEMSRMIDQFYEGALVGPLTVESPGDSITGVVRRVSPVENKVYVAWNSGPIKQHDPDEIQLKVFPTEPSLSGRAMTETVEDNPGIEDTVKTEKLASRRMAGAKFVGDPRTHGIDTPVSGGTDVMEKLTKILHDEALEFSRKRKEVNASIGRRRVSIEFETEEALNEYLKEHPGSDKSKHTVKETEESKKKEEAPPKEEMKEKVKEVVKEKAETKFDIPKERESTAKSTMKGMLEKHGVADAKFKVNKTGVSTVIRGGGKAADGSNVEIELEINDGKKKKGVVGYAYVKRPDGSVAGSEEDIYKADLSKEGFDEVVGKVTGDLSKHLGKKAHVGRRMAAYHADKGRIYRRTQLERQMDMMICPRCRPDVVEMEKQPFVRGVGIWVCPGCGWKITTDKVMD